MHELSDYYLKYSVPSDVNNPSVQCGIMLYLFTLLTVILHVICSEMRPCKNNIAESGADPG